VADCGTNDAAVTVTTTGGNTPYSYSLDGTNYQRSRPSSRSSTIADVTGPGLKAATTAATCTNDDGTLLVTGSGVGPFDYSIDGQNYQSNGQFNGLPVGYTQVYVKDANGCVTSNSIRVAIFNNIVIDKG